MHNRQPPQAQPRQISGQLRWILNRRRAPIGAVNFLSCAEFVVVQHATTRVALPCRHWIQSRSGGIRPSAG